MIYFIHIILKHVTFVFATFISSESFRDSYSLHFSTVFSCVSWKSLSSCDLVHLRFAIYKGYDNLQDVIHKYCSHHDCCDLLLVFYPWCIYFHDNCCHICFIYGDLGSSTWFFALSLVSDHKLCWKFNGICIVNHFRYHEYSSQYHTNYNDLFSDTPLVSVI